MKKIKGKFSSFIKRHKKPIFALSIAAITAAVIYTDIFNLTANTPVSDYIYNTETSENNIKILGEAALVDSTQSDIDNDQDSFFVSATLNREKSRDEALETLQVVVDSSESLPEARNKALTEIMEIAGDIEIETIVEEMIKAKGFEECVAIISGDNINVIVKSEGLLTSEVAQITDIVRNETGFGAENIRIVEKM